MGIKRVLSILAAGVALVASACSSNVSTGSGSSSSAGGSSTPGVGGTAVGFIFVGPRNDFGYNQAAFDGSQAMAKGYPNLKVLTAENVPEDDNATRAMNEMVGKGAKIIFATSYGHLDAAKKVAGAHPDVVVVQQGNILTGAIPPNIGTYFGTVYEPVYLAGIAAGKATKTNKLGFVYAFPISQSIDNIDAFELGAKSVNPQANTYVVNTSNWCDPAKQAEAANSLLSQGVDVLTQHQDCTGTIIKAAEAKGAYSVGYHADASSLAPKGWLTGSQWNWGPVYTDIVKAVLAGTFTGSKYNANYRVGYKTGDNPFVQSPFGPSVSDDTKAAIAQAKTDISSPAGSPFKGPVLDQSGKPIIPGGAVPDYATIEAITTFVDGIVGNIPRS